MLTPCSIRNLELAIFVLLFSKIFNSFFRNSIRNKIKKLKCFQVQKLSYNIEKNCVDNFCLGFFRTYFDAYKCSKSQTLILTIGTIVDILSGKSRNWEVSYFRLGEACGT